MKTFIFLMLFALTGAVSLAQPAVTPPPGQPAAAAPAQPSLDAERARIARERAALEAGFAADEAACYRKFFVNKCLDEVKGRSREALADLRRQDISIDEQERRAKGAAQLLKTEEKSSPEKQQEAADRRAAAVKDFDARMQREKEKNDSRATVQSNEKSNSAAAAERAKGAQEKAGVRSSKDAAAAAEVAKFNERLEKAKDRQARHDREQAARTGPPARSLPDPGK